MAAAGDSRDRGGVSARTGWPVALLLGLAVALALLAATFRLSREAALADLTDAAASVAQERVQALESILARQRAVATVLSDDSVMRQALLAPSIANRSDASVKLAGLQAQTRSSVLYLLDREGVAIAASNWNEAASFIGQDYSFRDYFSQAILAGEATQFALGTVSGRPGLYLSHDITAGADQVGVIVVKVEFDDLEANWARDPNPTFVTDEAGQVFLTSLGDLRFQQIPAPEPTQFATHLEVPGAPGWRLSIHSSSRPALRWAALTTGSAGLLLLLLALAAGRVWRHQREIRQKAEAERRYRADLERAVAERTRDLSDEMRERRAAEERLSKLQGDLVQANKLAALGQITAGVAHEVNQPLATIKLLAQNGLAMLPSDQAPDVAGNLGSIVRMTDRIAQITTELRSFSRKATGHVGPVSVKEAVEASVLLAASRGSGRDMRLEVAPIPADQRVMAETVRLEQVMVNLIQNAQEALAGRPDPLIRILVGDGPMVRITVADNGPGLAPEIAATLFTPFATSKPEGVGLGLVISQDIARDFGGWLTAEPPRPGTGAVFHLDLPRAP